MYRIIASDGNEYGPVSLEMLRQWNIEGRVNSQTRVRPESGTEWTTLGALPEFAFPASPPSPAIITAPEPVVGSAGSRAAEAPAIVLMVVTGIGFFWSLLSLVLHAAGTKFQTWRPPQQNEEIEKLLEAFSGGIGVASSLLGMACSIFLFFSALQMYRRRHYGLAFAGAILVMIPCLSPCCCLGLPVGIWALIVLSRPEVKASFQ